MGFLELIQIFDRTFVIGVFAKLLYSISLCYYAWKDLTHINLEFYSISKTYSISILARNE